MYAIFILKYVTWLITASIIGKGATSGGWIWLHFLNVFVKKQSEYFTNPFYGILLIRRTVTI